MAWDKKKKYTLVDRWPLISLLLLMTHSPAKPLTALGKECGKCKTDNERWGRRQGHKGAKCQFNFRWDVSMIGRHIHGSCGLSTKWKCLPTAFSLRALSAISFPCFSDYLSLLVLLVTIKMHRTRQAAGTTLNLSQASDHPAGPLSRSHLLSEASCPGFGGGNGDIQRPLPPNSLSLFWRMGYHQHCIFPRS